MAWAKRLKRVFAIQIETFLRYAGKLLSNVTRSRNKPSLH